MKPTITTTITVTQTLTPQQIQYLKLLQMPLQQLEQKIEEELQENPLLEAVDSPDSLEYETIDIESEQESEQPLGSSEPTEIIEYQPSEPLIDEARDPFDIYRKIWQEDEVLTRKSIVDGYEDEDQEPFPIKQTVSFIQEMIQQFRMLPLREEELLLGEQILGNVDSDGYLRTPLEEIVDDTNNLILEYNLEQGRTELVDVNTENPAVQFAVQPEAKISVELALNNVATKGEKKFLTPVTLQDAERVLKIIQNLDPPGVASRNLQECLIAQTKAIPDDTPGKMQAYKILTEAYEEFSKKHFQTIQRKFGWNQEDIKLAFEFIRKLNPKPGIDDTHPELNTVIPDFFIEKDQETGELMVILNESTIPALRINKTYEQMRKDVALNKKDKETREWLKAKYDDAKFLLQALAQRKTTMLKVMTAIAARQKAFFVQGPSALKPLIYKDIAEDTGLDVATVCRIVNNKFVQTEFGTFELKYFFSESLPTDDGEEVSTKVIKQVIKDIIDNEPKDNPYSDEKIVEELKKRGYNVARRTVAKYREQMKIPIARLRKEI
ncbi:MAG: RNA polymerase factor sigma-54 [Ignavibacteria bacterium]|nr:RNA polymerase factor sigma-54 [Ignavibacteria bacterium]